MWILSRTGFYSIVNKPTDPKGKLTIRARVRHDLERLGIEYLPSMTSILETDDSDYRYRTFAKPEDVADALSKIALEINYSNFKDAVSKNNPYRGLVYSQVWAELLRLENEEISRKIDNAHCEFIRQLCCVICKNNIETECCHVRFSDARIGKINPGVAARPSDCFTVPLCGKHHREQHTGNEQAFWNKYRIDPILLSLALYAVSGDAEEAERIINSLK